MLCRKTSQVAKKSAKERLETRSALHLLTPKKRAGWDRPAEKCQKRFSCLGPAVVWVHGRGHGPSHPSEGGRSALPFSRPFAARTAPGRCAATPPESLGRRRVRLSVPSRAGRPRAVGPPFERPTIPCHRESQSGYTKRASVVLRWRAPFALRVVLVAVV